MILILNVPTLKWILCSKSCLDIVRCCCLCWNVFQYLIFASHSLQICPFLNKIIFKNKSYEKYIIYDASLSQRYIVMMWVIMSATFLIKWLLVINFILQAVLGCSPLILNCIRGSTCSKIKTFEDPNVFLLNDCSGYSHRERHSPDRKQKKTSFTYRGLTE